MKFQFITNKIDLIRLSNLIKLDNDISGCVLPKILKSNEYIIALIDKISNQIMSFIWFGIYENILIGKHMNTNYSYTIIKYRFNGLNKMLRLKLEEFALIKQIYKLTSKPFDDSLSLNILLNLGYVSNKNFYIKIIR